MQDEKPQVNQATQKLSLRLLIVTSRHWFLENRRKRKLFVLPQAKNKLWKQDGPCLQLFPCLRGHTLPPLRFHLGPRTRLNKMANKFTLSVKPKHQQRI